MSDSELRRQKWRRVINLMMVRAPRNVRRERHYFFEELCSPMSYVCRMEKIQQGITNELERRERKQQAIAKCHTIKEELMAVCWHPDRVEKLVDLGILEEMW